MNKLALIILGATALAPAAAMAQTVNPSDPYEGTPQVPLKKPGTAAGAKAPVASAPIAQPTPPAGITWRNQAPPAPSMAPMERAAGPLPVVTQRPAPPPIVTQRAAPPPPMIAPARRVEAVPPPLPQNFVIRREPGPLGAGSAELEIRRELEDQMGDAPARVIVRRHANGHMADGPTRVIVRRERHGAPVDPNLVDDYDRMEESFGADYGDDADYSDDHGAYAGEPIQHDYDAPAGHSAYGHGYAGGCCSGGMITETITTTTTYPPTVEERVVHHETRSHPPRRTYKRKLRGR